MEMDGRYCECIGEVDDDRNTCPDCGREYGLPIQVTADGYGATFTSFQPTTDEPGQLGGEVLAYVLANGHTIGIDLAALRFSRAVAVRAMHGRKSDDPVVKNVNVALNLVDRAIRSEEAAERVTVDLQVGDDRPHDRPTGNRPEVLQAKPKSPIGPVPSGVINF